MCFRPKTSAKFRKLTNTLNALTMGPSLIQMNFTNEINITMVPRN